MDVAAQASKLMQCVANGPGYANASPTLGPLKTSSTTVDGIKAARVDADVTIADPSRGVKGDSVVIIAVDTKPVTIFMGSDTHRRCGLGGHHQPDRRSAEGRQVTALGAKRFRLAGARGRRDVGGFGATAQHGGIALRPMLPLGLVGPLDCRRRAQDPPVGGFRKIGQPRSLVDRIADYRVFIPVFGADVAGENAARRNSDAEIDSATGAVGCPACVRWPAPPTPARRSATALRRRPARRRPRIC